MCAQNTKDAYFRKTDEINEATGGAIAWAMYSAAGRIIRPNAFKAREFERFLSDNSWETVFDPDTGDYLASRAGSLRELEFLPAAAAKFQRYFDTHNINDHAQRAILCILKARYIFEQVAHDRMNYESLPSSNPLESIAMSMEVVDKVMRKRSGTLSVKRGAKKQQDYDFAPPSTEAEEAFQALLGEIRGIGVPEKATSRIVAYLSAAKDIACCKEHVTFTEALKWNGMVAMGGVN